ncbi:nicotinate phosphoribosyltransferase [Thiohalobacter sp. IOR34]|uniref:nicotinate phosphoribosyltransferase n=1 Tax=Thiohalobacter sp. IOR34 TaxID=3057176 RepID=UPI0025AEE1CA|nr:nicotinate phosphoribosyltransferase [Thiohalobacter sp. IOR34]WJW76563.1 nicotinate phosphoribosyltransferase [Thiohalobacter sp. IOR34]
MRYRSDSPLLTDLYQLTMMQSYLDHGLEETAVFEFFVRRLPRERNFLLAAGLAGVIDFLQALHFEAGELEWLEASGRFRRPLLDYLAGLRFEGDVDAMPEGTAFFADEPILRVTAPLPVAQLIESRIINLLQFETLIASKAARMRLAAAEALLVDFGMRRAHAGEAGLLAARAAYLAGLNGTATVLAGQLFDIPLFGTMAHSYIEAHDDEMQAFEHFALSHPDNVVLLIDTYDTEAGAKKVVELAPRLAARGIHIKAVRIDSGDLAEHARRVRAILDAGGLQQTGIFASGNLDEYRLQALLAAGAPISGFGIGTRMDVSSDAPSLDCAYKLQEYAGRPRRKRSEGKATWAGRKQVYRRLDDQGRLAGDTLTILDDRQPGEPLLQPVMRGGRLLAPLPDLERIREHAARELQRLPERLRRLEAAEPRYAVDVSPALQAVTRQADAAATAVP